MASASAVELDAETPSAYLGSDDVIEEHPVVQALSMHLASQAPTPVEYDGLIAIHLESGWRRQDPRGNKPGVDARFDLRHERLACKGSARGTADRLRRHGLDCVTGGSSSGTLVAAPVGSSAAATHAQPGLWVTGRRRGAARCQRCRR